jgi:hypothetical protein
MKISTATLGYTHIGKNREVKKALEAFWNGKIEAESLQKTIREVEEKKLENSIRRRNRSHWHWRHYSLRSCIRLGNSSGINS